MNRPSARSRIAALLLAPLIFLGLVEGGLRLLGFRYDPARGPGAASVAPAFARTDLLRPDRDLLWVLRPGIRVHDLSQGFFHVRANADGFRGPDFPKEPDRGEFRVVCLGDSVTFGLGTEEADSWPFRLERELSRSPLLGGRRARVIPLALPGWGAVQGIRAFRRYRHLEPDAVVFWFGMNDSKEALGGPDSGLAPPGSLEDRLPGWLRGARLYDLVRAAADRLRPAPETGGRRVRPAEFADAVRTLIEEERGGGPRVIFVRFPQRIDPTIEQLAHVVARCRDTGVKLVRGPEILLSPWAPWEKPVGEGERIETPDGPALLFAGDEANRTATVADVEADLDRLRSMKAYFDGLLASLPDDSLTQAEMFGPTPPHIVFTDGCHLTAAGAALAARAVARRILAGLR